jgi:hypothetical protein
MEKRKRDLQDSKRASSQASRDPDLDLFAQGPLADIVERFRARLLEEAGRTASDRKINGNDLEQAYERLLVSRSSGDWSVLNRRRVFLIQKQVAGDILPSEVAELEGLQVTADRHLSEVVPRPLEALWDLKRKLVDE